MDIVQDAIFEEYKSCVFTKEPSDTWLDASLGDCKKACADVSLALYKQYMVQCNGYLKTAVQ